MRLVNRNSSKDNPQLFRGVLTGILRVAKESIFSGLNNLGVYTLLAVEFNTDFGFTESEVKTLLADYQLADRYDEVAAWYNGYLFGGQVIYNPWSILNYIASQDKLPRPYWLNTGDYTLIDQLVTRGGRELRAELLQLLEDETLIRPIYDDIVMRDIEKLDDLLWSFLLFSGYLKCGPQPVRRNWYELKIPNREIKRIYEDMVERWFELKVRLTNLESLVSLKFYDWLSSSEARSCGSSSIR